MIQYICDLTCDCAAVGLLHRNAKLGMVFSMSNFPKSYLIRAKSMGNDSCGVDLAGHR